MDRLCLPPAFQNTVLLIDAPNAQDGGHRITTSSITNKYLSINSDLIAQAMLSPWPFCCKPYNSID